MPELVSFAEFARIKGVKPPSVTEAVKSRIAQAVVIRNGRRMLNRDLALSLWDRSSRSTYERVRTGKPVASSRQRRADREPTVEAPPAEVVEDRERRRPADATAAAVAEAVMKLPDDMIPEIAESLERKEHYRAELAKVQALQARSEVGSIREMEREAFALAKAVREGMLSIIPRISADLAATSDAFEVERLLEAEVSTALRMLADG